ncbi:protein of unknown function [Magnetospirillum sp. XM-1]|nr:protein of unknown function [Magnetospirillum sp. XM-1]
MPVRKYEDKIVGFIDVVGFKNIIDKSCSEGDPDLIVRLISQLGSAKDESMFSRDGGGVCPQSNRIAFDLNFKITQLSDSVVISCEISPAGVVNMLHFCRMVFGRLLLRERVLCRGFITMGKVYHHGNYIFGPAYQDAVTGEKHSAAININGEQIGMPYIQIDQVVIDEISRYDDSCVKRMVGDWIDTLNCSSIISPVDFFKKLVDCSFSADDINEAKKQINSIKDIVLNLCDYHKSRMPTNDKEALKVLSIMESLSNALLHIDSAEKSIYRSNGIFPCYRN